jgi:hypothetical protein
LIQTLAFRFKGQICPCCSLVLKQHWQ